LASPSWLLAGPSFISMTVLLSLVLFIPGTGLRPASRLLRLFHDDAGEFDA
jgi:hypothetical protein